MKPLMKLTSPLRDDQSQRFMAIFKNFKKESHRFITLWTLKPNHSVLWQYLGILSIRA